MTDFKVPPDKESLLCHAGLESPKIHRTENSDGKTKLLDYEIGEKNLSVQNLMPNEKRIVDSHRVNERETAENAMLTMVEETLQNTVGTFMNLIIFERKNQLSGD